MDELEPQLRTAEAQRAEDIRPVHASHTLAPTGGDATADNRPRCSTETLRSLDISLNIPRIVFPMDAEDSPWGGIQAIAFE